MLMQYFCDTCQRTVDNVDPDDDRPSVVIPAEEIPQPAEVFAGHRFNGAWCPGKPRLVGPQPD